MVSTSILRFLFLQVFKFFLQVYHTGLQFWHIRFYFGYFVLNCLDCLLPRHPPVLPCLCMTDCCSTACHIPRHSFDICFIKTKRIQDQFLGFGNCMIQFVVSTVTTDHFNLFKFTDRSRNSHILLFCLHTDHLFFKKIVDPVTNDQCHKFYKDLDDMLAMTEHAHS